MDKTYVFIITWRKLKFALNYANSPAVLNLFLNYNLETIISVKLLMRKSRTYIYLDSFICIFISL